MSLLFTSNMGPRERNKQDFVRGCLWTRLSRNQINRPFPSSPGPLFQNEGRCWASDMKIIFLSHANKTHLYKKGCAPSLILKVRVFGTRKWPINPGLFIGKWSATNMAKDRVLDTRPYVRTNLLVDGNSLSWCPSLFPGYSSQQQAFSNCNSIRNGGRRAWIRMRYF